jgi:hypothetical protein
MRRAVGFLGTILLIALSFSLYTLVNAVKAQEKKLKYLDVAIAKENEATRVLKADWTYLNQPERLQALARQHLTLVPTVARQIVILANLPEKSAVIETAPPAPSVDASELPFRDVPPAAIVAPKPDLPAKPVAVADPKAVEPKSVEPKAAEPKPVVKPASAKPSTKPATPKLSTQKPAAPKAAPSQKGNAIARKAAPAQGLP